MSQACSCYIGKPNNKELKVISSMKESSICVCQCCGAFWQQTASGWDYLVGRDNNLQIASK